MKILITRALLLFAFFYIEMSAMLKNPTFINKPDLEESLLGANFEERGVPCSGVMRRRRPDIEMLFYYVRTNNFEQVRRLLQQEDANPDGPIRGGMTPLMRAVDEGFYEISELLLQSGASINHIPHRHVTQCSALHYAVNKNDLAHVAIVRLLLKYGADCFKTDRFGETPFGKVQRLGYQNLMDLFRAYMQQQSGGFPFGSLQQGLFGSGEMLDF